MRFQRNLSTVTIHDVLGERQTDTGSAGFGGAQ
jgi:hypothetical protein